MKRIYLIISLSIIITLNASLKKPIRGQRESVQTQRSAFKEVIFSFDAEQDVADAAWRKCPEACHIAHATWTGAVSPIIKPAQSTGRCYSTCICE